MLADATEFKSNLICVRLQGERTFCFFITCTGAAIFLVHKLLQNCSLQSFKVLKVKKCCCNPIGSLFTFIRDLKKRERERVSKTKCEMFC